MFGFIQAFARMAAAVLFCFPCTACTSRVNWGFLLTLPALNAVGDGVCHPPLSPSFQPLLSISTPRKTDLSVQCPKGWALEWCAYTSFQALLSPHQGEVTVPKRVVVGWNGLVETFLNTCRLVWYGHPPSFVLLRGDLELLRNCPGGV